MTHSITPPPELVQQWYEQLFGCPDEPEINAYELTRLASQWGADKELEACCDALNEINPHKYWSKRLRAARRPKPPSLKERLSKAIIDGDEREALKLLETLSDD